jgi:Flp pilus assembly protein TadD
MKDINYALMLIKANKLEGAKDVLEELLQSDPANKDILYNLGMCYTELDEPEKAPANFLIRHLPPRRMSSIECGRSMALSPRSWTSPPRTGWWRSNS